MGGFHLLMPPLGERGWVGSGEGAFIGAWLSVGRGTGMPGWRVYGGGMCAISSVLVSILNQRVEILGISMSPASSSTLIHHVLRLKFR